MIDVSSSLLIPFEAEPLKSCISTNKLPDLERSSSSGESSDTGSRKCNAVSFDKIEIREYNRDVSDNPSVSEGPPVGLGWEYENVANVSVEDYENTRPQRRSRYEMLMGRDYRVRLLTHEWGVSTKELMEAVRDANITKRQRRSTACTPRAIEKRDELMERAFRKLSKIVNSKKRKEREQHKQWRVAQ